MEEREQKKINIDDINTKELCELIKKEVIGTAEVKHITNYAGGIVLALIGYRGSLEGLVEYTIYQNKLNHHQFVPVGALTTSLLIRKLENVAALYNHEHDLIGE